MKVELLKLPLSLVLTDAGLVVTVLSSKVIVIDLSALNPVPLTVTSLPTEPDVELTLIDCWYLMPSRCGFRGSCRGQ